MINDIQPISIISTPQNIDLEKLLKHQKDNNLFYGWVNFKDKELPKGSKILITEIQNKKPLFLPLQTTLVFEIVKNHKANLIIANIISINPSEYFLLQDVSNPNKEFKVPYNKINNVFNIQKVMINGEQRDFNIQAKQLTDS